MMTRRVVMMVLALTTGLAVAGNLAAQDSIDALLEKARSQGQKYEKLKRVLNEEPDQNVRLAAFDLTVTELMQLIPSRSMPGWPVPTGCCRRRPSGRRS